MTPRFFGSKVITVQEMSRIEQLAKQEGCREDLFIEEAGKKIARAALELMETKKRPKTAFLLIGKGNKGADAYAAGLCLLEKDLKVHALALFPLQQCSEWNRKFMQRFVQGRGTVASVWEKKRSCSGEGLLIDGLFGTGFQGQVDGLAAEIIRWVNDSGIPILSIDIPSGLDGTTGEIRGVCVHAHTTVTLGMAKIGLFLREGWNVCGQLLVENFGLSNRWIEAAQATAYLPDETRLPLPQIVRNRHKYQAGYVLGLSGSAVLRGAPKLAGLAALRAGAGIVRVFHRGQIGEAPIELICQKWNAGDWKRELARAQALFAGPGMGMRSERWHKIKVPMVLDADALQKEMTFGLQTIATPHRGEMLRLLGIEAVGLEEAFLILCQKFAEKKKLTLLLKGAPTFIFSPLSLPLIIPRGDPGMATAGTGDVLTGLVTGLLAQGLSCHEAAATGAYLHALAGERAARLHTSYSMIASDLITHLPEAFETLLNASE
ncbi:MAG: NAD(P)H-hydrate dehydratase [Chlamydiia bacterium]|nr:NAD(P)H-hydrate dehydratase [Chlamydiia bacterium]